MIKKDTSDTKLDINIYANFNVTVKRFNLRIILSLFL